MTKAARTRTTALKPCECSLWEFDLDVDRDDDYSTGCTAMTHRTFAQGHDAKLVGFLVRAELAGHDISKRDGGMLVTYADAVDAAAKISEALATKAELMLAAAKARADKKAARKATKKDVEAANANTAFATERKACIKIGRWTYDATINIETGEATYNAKNSAQGETRIAQPGKFTEVN